MNEQKHIRVRTLAQRLDVTPRYIYYLIALGKLKAIRLNEHIGSRTIRVTEEAYQDFLKRCSRNQERHIEEQLA